MKFRLISATKRSDKYIDEQSKRSSKKKPNKKSKKNKKSKHKEITSESEEGKIHNSFNSMQKSYEIRIISEPVALHVVSSFIEMPEGASVSDTDDKDKNEMDDPHRALDIDLDV